MSATAPTSRRSAAICAASLADVEVLTPAEFRERSRQFWLFGTGAGAALFAGALLGVIVGTVIVAQTLYSSTKDHLNEFATLRAIGSSRDYIYKVIICQALLSAVIVVLAYLASAPGGAHDGGERAADRHHAWAEHRSGAAFSYVLRDADAVRGAATIARARADLQEALGPDVFSIDGRPMEEIVGQLLRERRYRITAAESCTGGLLMTRLTEVPGSSEYVHSSVVTYDNEAKVKLLNVPAALIEEHGAVSEPVALAMADGVRAITAADVAVAITGVAGPGGGTPAKPVGTVVVAVIVPSQPAFVRTFSFVGGRAMVRFQATQAALDRVQPRPVGLTCDCSWRSISPRRCAMRSGERANGCGSRSVAASEHAGCRRRISTSRSASSDTFPTIGSRRSSLR